MAGKLVNESAIEVDHHELESAMAAYTQESTKEHLVTMMTVMRKARFLVPAEFPGNMTDEQKGYIERGEAFPQGKAPAMHPILVENQEGERYAPAFTSKEAIQDIDSYPIIINVNFQEVCRIASAEDLGLSGILVNPQTDKMVLHPEFIQTMQQLEETLKQAKEEPKKQEIRMSREEFIVFARKAVEQTSLPHEIFTKRQEFMDDLDEKREELICELYRAPYGDNVPCDYSPDDFSVMLLDIDDETQMATVDMPPANAPLLCESAYIYRNPVKDEMRYFTIERSETGMEILCEITDDGTRTVLGAAPEAGTELYHVLDLIREGK